MTIMDKVLVVGAGGHGKVVGELVELSSAYELAGWVDRGHVGKEINGGVILGGDDDLEKIYQSGVTSVIIGVGSIGDVSVKKKLAELLEEIGFQFISLRHPSAVISMRSDIAQGTCMMAGSVIQTDTSIGKHCIVNTRAVIEHDCSIGSFVHVAPGAVIAGGVHIEDDVHIGLGAVVREGLHVGQGALIAAGAVVIDNVPVGARVAGCPARRI